VAIFTHSDQEGRFLATELARGPWDENAQHGGAPAALLMRAFERVPNPGRLAFARVAYELLRPVPLAAIEVRADVVRQGRRVQLLEGSILGAESEPLVVARALRVQPADSDAPGTPGGAPPPGPDGGAGKEYPGRGRQFATDAMDVRFVDGSFLEPGRATAWFRFRHPLVEGEEPSPLQLLAAAADFANSVGASLPWDRYSFVNPDLTLYVEREPDPGWVCVAASTGVQTTGVAAANLYDERGPVGNAIQALLVAERTPTSGERP
jgi:hypothetical protein